MKTISLVVKIKSKTMIKYLKLSNISDFEKNVFVGQIESSLLHRYTLQQPSTVKMTQKLWSD
jgi:hypothetical protein